VAVSRVSGAGLENGGLPYQAQRVSLPASAPYLTADHAVTVVGYNDMQELMEAWARLFSATNPDVRFAFDLRGTRFAPAALANGSSAFAPMGGEMTPEQLAAYRETAGVAAEPVPFKVAHASLDPKALSGPIGMFVHWTNPLVSLDMAQLARAFSGEAETWGSLGANGEWAERPVHLVGVAPRTVLGLFVQSAVLHGRAFATTMQGFPQSAEVVQQVGADPLALGFAAAMRAAPDVRALSLASGPGAPPVGLTRDNVIAGRYPLDRFLLIYVRPPLTPIAREFIRLALSRDGQLAVARSSLGYLPLSGLESAAERTKLDRLSGLQGTP
jgi:phosphate transport system substrate-binding protein